MSLCLYVDNSNVWIEGQRASAVAKGMAPSIWEAQKQQIVDFGWRYDFGRLYELACPPEIPVGRSILFGSRPPANDSLWAKARSDGFEVEVLDRNAGNREKGVDTGIVTLMLEDSFQFMRPGEDTAVLVAGDKDYLSAVESLRGRDLAVRVVAWSHATNRDLRNAASEFVALDPHLDFLALEGNHSAEGSSPGERQLARALDSTLNAGVA